MEFFKKLLGLSNKDNDYIGLTSFQDNKKSLDDEKPSVKKEAKKEPTLTELLKRAN